MSAAEATLQAPPHNYEAEQSLLGSLLIDNSAIGNVVQKMDERAFYRRAHQELFKVVAELYDQRKAIDLITLVEELRKRGSIDEVGGESYLAELMSAVPSAANVTHYAEIVREKSILRNLINICQQILSETGDATREPEDLLDMAEGLIIEAGQSRLSKEPIDMASIVTKVGHQGQPAQCLGGPNRAQRL
jgi:replicative DNA helicase